MKKLDKTGKINLLLWFIAITLCLVTLTIALAGYFTFGFRTLNQTPSLAELEDHGDDNINISSNISKGILLSSTSVNNKNVITATVEGMEGVDKSLVWDFAWKNDTTWANGKDVKNYIGLVVNSDTLSASVENKLAFAEPIIVTARSASKNDVFGTCTIDYLKKITAFTKTSNESAIVVGYDSKTNDTGAVTTAEFTYSEGTLIPTIGCTLVVSYNPVMIEQINEVLANNGISGTVNEKKTKTIEFNNGYTFGFNITTDLAKGPLSRNKTALNLINDLFMEKCNDLQWYCSLSLEVQLSYEGIEYKTYSYDVGNYTFDTSKLTSKCATSVKLDKQQIIF